MAELHELTAKVKRVMAKYQQEYPYIKVDRDFWPFKCTEELGECIQTYLMLTDRGRQSGKSKDQIKEEFSKEMADVFGFLLAFADSEGIDLGVEIEKKWFSRLDK